MTKSPLPLLASAALLLGLAACGAKTYQNVENGAKGATSPMESGQQGDRANQTPPPAPAGRNATPTENTVYREPFSNGNVDATMEGSGNLAGQGNYRAAAEPAAPPSGR